MLIENLSHFAVRNFKTRMLAWVERGANRLVKRWRAERTDIYPELDILAGLPAGTALDGEVMVLKKDKSRSLMSFSICCTSASPR